MFVEFEALSGNSFSVNPEQVVGVWISKEVIDKLWPELSDTEVEEKIANGRELEL